MSYSIQLHYYRIFRLLRHRLPPSETLDLLAGLVFFAFYFYAPERSAHDLPPAHRYIISSAVNKCFPLKNCLVPVSTLFRSDSTPFTASIRFSNIIIWAL